MYVCHLLILLECWFLPILPLLASISVGYELASREGLSEEGPHCAPWAGGIPGNNVHLFRDPQALPNTNLKKKTTLINKQI